MFNKLLPRALEARLQNSTIAGNTGVMTIGIVIQIALQGSYFILITRTMGASAYGAFISVTALAGIAGAFAGWGGDQLLIRTVARSREEFHRALGNALIYFAISAPALTIVAVLTIPFLVDASVPWRVVLLVVLSDVVFARANTFGINCFQAFERGRAMAFLGILLYGARAIAALVWRGVDPNPEPLSWAWYYFASSLIAGVLTMLGVLVVLGRPIWRVRWRDWKDGGFFALQMGSFIGFRDIDKPIVVALSSLSQAGLYAAAFRLADVAAVPVRALMFSTYVRFFQHGAHGARGSLDFARSLVPVGLALGGVALIGMVFVSTFATAVVGSNYAGIGTVLLLLSPLPALYALYFIGADALISGGHVGYRTLAQLILPGVDVGLCAVLVPHYGAAGAAVAAVLTHAVLVAVVWTMAFYLARKNPAERPS